MKALVVYESLFGDTHAIADAVAAGLRAHGKVRVVPVGEAVADLVAWADLMVAGGPTQTELVAGEAGRATAWGDRLASLALDTSPS